MILPKVELAYFHSIRNQVEMVELRLRQQEWRVLRSSNRNQAEPERRELHSLEWQVRRWKSQSLAELGPRELHRPGL